MNGSDVNIGCQVEVFSFIGFTLCGRVGSPAISYLTDGITPDIDTSILNWASQLVTVRKNNATRRSIPYDHVVLVFDTLNPVNLTSVELDMFICPQWNIGAPSITVYASITSGYKFIVNDSSITFHGTVTDSLTVML